MGQKATDRGGQTEGDRRDVPRFSRHLISNLFSRNDL